MAEEGGGKGRRMSIEVDGKRIPLSVDGIKQASGATAHGDKAPDLAKNLRKSLGLADGE